eukprot:2824571-Pyramimonas_sp.AAC.1
MKRGGATGRGARSRLPRDSLAGKRRMHPLKLCMNGTPARLPRGTGYQYSEPLKAKSPSAPAPYFALGHRI